MTTPVAAGGGGGGAPFASEVSFSRHVDSETPAPYEAVRPNYDMVGEARPAGDPGLEGQGPVYEPIDGEQSRTNRVLHSPAQEDTDAGKGGRETPGQSSPSLNEQTPNNSRSGSRLDLLDTGSMKRSRI